MEEATAQNATEFTDILKEIVSTNQNDIIIFTIVIVIMFVLVGIPLCWILLKQKNKENDSSLNEKKLLMDVIKENSSAIISLKTTLELNNSTIIGLLEGINRNTNETVSDVNLLIDDKDDLKQAIKDGNEEIKNQNKLILNKIDELKK